MEKRLLHMISFDVPYPPDYGGAYAVFHELKVLKAAGMRIHLHCYDYGRGKQKELEKYCEKVFYYKRTFPYPWQWLKPYIVSSRRSPDLLQNLKDNPGKIYIHGLHCTSFANDSIFRGTVLRAHNREELYYRFLAKSERHLLKKAYLLTESLLLRRYEKRIAKKFTMASMNGTDGAFFNHHNSRSKTIPPLISYSHVLTHAGRGDFILYHGNLSVSENEAAALLLLRNITGQRVIIAGKKPSKRLLERVAEHPAARVIANPDRPTMDSLISEAHIIFLHSCNATGVKMKLIESLYKGRFLLANKQAVEGTDLAELCHVVEHEKDYAEKADKLRNKVFDEGQLEYRERMLRRKFDNQANIRVLLQLLS